MEEAEAGRKFKGSLPVDCKDHSNMKRLTLKLNTDTDSWEWTVFECLQLLSIYRLVRTEAYCYHIKMFHFQA